jgi:RNA polymerase sigma factor (TIGR02999 family)
MQPDPARTRIDETFSEVHTQLRSLADALMRTERPAHTLQPTAAVHETYLRLIASPPRHCRDRNHFLAIAATTLRRVLIDHGRRVRSDRRGGGVRRAPLDDAIADRRGHSLMHEVAEAVDLLANAEPRGARVVELRVFAGFTMEEIARQLGVSKPTVERDWRFCRAWLANQLADGEDPASGPDHWPRNTAS